MSVFDPKSPADIARLVRDHAEQMHRFGYMTEELVSVAG